MSASFRKEFLERLGAIKPWKRGNERAPHKPLLLLLALARIAHGQDRLMSFEETESPLCRLLEQFGPLRRSTHPEYPFWRLQNDGLWDVPNSASWVRRKGHSDPRKTELIKHKAVGGFPAPMFQALRRDERLRNEAVATLLRSHFPESFHQDVLDELGLSLEVLRLQRDPAFRDTVIQAYEHQCAICGYDAKLDKWDLALDAAHIKWHQAGGPSVVQNGIALCAIHHKALDRGAMTVSDDLVIHISGSLHGSTGMSELFLAYKGKALRTPHSKSMLPGKEYLAWHRREVFRGPARE
jgi:putative restriction endonuclease